MWVDRKLCNNDRLEMAKRAEEWIGKVTWMSRVNGQVDVDGGRMVWELLARPSMVYAAQVWWTRGCTAQEAGVGTDESRYVIVRSKQYRARVAVQGGLGWRKLEEGGKR